MEFSLTACFAVSFLQSKDGNRQGVCVGSAYSWVARGHACDYKEEIWTLHHFLDDGGYFVSSLMSCSTSAHNQFRNINLSASTFCNENGKYPNFEL
jgi:hypothetical protein